MKQRKFIITDPLHGTIHKWLYIENIATIAAAKIIFQSMAQMEVYMYSPCLHQERKVNKQKFLGIRLETTLALRMRKTFRRYKEPARMPHIPGKRDLFQDDRRSCKKETEVYHWALR